MNLIKVESSNIEAVGYEGNDLLVQYKSGGTYRYAEVPKAIYESLLVAESKGKFVNSEIKSNYRCTRI